jgi:putative membrane protein
MLVAALGAAACTAAQDDAAARAAADSAAMAAADTAAAAAPARNDAQIAHIAVTANAIDSSAGAYAVEHATAAAVKDFARTMVRDHGAVNKQAVALATKLNVTPEDNDVSRGLQEGAGQSRTALEGLTGAAFDRAYMDREIAYHQSVIDALNQTLIPGAQNAELKQLLTSVAPNFDAHLARAKSVRQGLGQ